MSSVSNKELQLTASVFKNYNGNFLAAVDWDQVALDAGYKDSKNAKVMWSRLEKKLVDAATRPAGGNDDEAGGNAPATPTKAGKKRKAAGAPAIEGPVFKRAVLDPAVIAAGHARIAAGYNDDNVGENAPSSPAKAGKKRKATEAPVVEAPGIKRTYRSPKKSNGSAANVDTDGNSVKVETSGEQEGEEEAA